jgi:hypothetical protein
MNYFTGKSAFFEASFSFLRIYHQGNEIMHQTIPDEFVLAKIYALRGHRIMLDHDLALLYGVETKALNQAVKRNISRFPDDFMFQINKNEFDILKSQIVTSRWGGVRKLPFAFTGNGIAMLSPHHFISPFFFRL